MKYGGFKLKYDDSELYGRAKLRPDDPTIYDSEMCFEGFCDFFEADFIKADIYVEAHNRPGKCRYLVEVLDIPVDEDLVEEGRFRYHPQQEVDVEIDGYKNTLFVSEFQALGVEPKVGIKFYIEFYQDEKEE